MTRAQLEHVIRAACAVADDHEVVIIGSQSILGQFPQAPPELLKSLEADVYPKNYPDRADLVEGALGELSMFHQTFGYYADGVAESTATLPQGWADRLVPICNTQTSGKIGWCLEIHDLLVSKLVAGREKDLEFATAVAQYRLASRRILQDRLASTDLSNLVRDRVQGLIDRDFLD